ncbi:unnamed protein product [Ixodes pacificus]
MYAALRDCHVSLQLEAGYVKAHLRLARCLYELRWTNEAIDCLQAFKLRFPDYATGQACQALERDLKRAIFSRTENGGRPLAPANRDTFWGRGTSSGARVLRVLPRPPEMLPRRKWSHWTSYALE